MARVSFDCDHCKKFIDATMKQNRQLPTTCLEAKGGANLFIDLSNISNLFKDRLKPYNG